MCTFTSPFSRLVRKYTPIPIYTHEFWALTCLQYRARLAEVEPQHAQASLSLTYSLKACVPAAKCKFMYVCLYVCILYVCMHGTHRNHGP
jgi:hypothetical protein